MYDICHPTYYHMSQLGCNDQVKLTTSFYVYMELCEVKRYWDVEYKYCEALQLFYLLAKKSKHAAIDTFIPWPTIHNITLDIISRIQHELKKDKFTFVFKEGDTTSVYYSICSGLVKPVDPEETRLLKQKQERKFELNKEINRNTANLYERALLFNASEHEKRSESNADELVGEESNEEEFFTPMEMNTACKSESIKLKCFTDNNKSDSPLNISDKSEVDKTETVKDLNNSNNIHQETDPTESIKATDVIKDSQSDIPTDDSQKI